MTVGVCRLRLRLQGSGSLKDKRQVVRSVLERVRQRYCVAAAEVDDQDEWQLATLGFSCVANSHRHADEVLDSVIAYIEETRLDVEIIAAERAVEELL